MLGRTWSGLALAVALWLPSSRSALATVDAAPGAATASPAAVELATPFSSTFFRGLVERLDVPLAGRRVWPKVRVVSSEQRQALALSTADVVVTSGLLERLAGVSIRLDRPATLDHALRTIQGDQARLGRLELVVGHELGHHAHGDTFPNQTARRQRVFSGEATRRLDGYTENLERLLASEDYRLALLESQRPAATERLLAYGAGYHGADGDRDQFLRALRSTGSLSRALTVLDARREGAGGLLLDIFEPIDGARRRLNALLLVRDTPELHRFVTEPVAISVKDVALQLRRGADGSVALTGLDRLAASAFTRSEVLVNSHAREFMADEHGLLLRTDGLRNRLELHSKVLRNEVGGSITATSATHPSELARLLNLVTLVKSNPGHFAEVLQDPVRLRVFRELPALELSMVDGAVKVTGFKGLYARLSPAERRLLHEYVTLRRGAVARESRGTSTRLWAPEGGATLEERVRKGAARNEHEGPVARRIDRLRDEVVGRRPFEDEVKQYDRYHAQRAVVERLARTSNTLVAIMIMNATTQYYEGGSVDFPAAVRQTLDSPDVWAGLAAAGLLDLALPSGNGAPRQVTARSFLPLHERLFLDTLQQCRSTVVALATFRVVSAYVQAASKGLEGAGAPLRLTDLFAGDGAAGRQFLRNLGAIATSPSAHAEILGQVLRDQLLTFEFALGAVGAVVFGHVGAAAGALAGTWMATKVGAVGGFAVGGPGGAMIGGACGFVGGAVAGTVGMLAMGAVGASLDTKLLDWRYARALERARRALVEDCPAEQARRLFESLAGLRTRLVTRLVERYAHGLQELAAAGSDHARTTALAAAALTRRELQDLYLDFLAMADAAAASDACRLAREELVAARGATLAELVTLTSRLDGLLAAARGQRSEPTPAPAETAPSFAGLVLEPAAAR